ncbi:phage holin family protein [Oscillatoria amoena NRMC-F 0135]|nr:phage holin family protein [Oscillatoria amoena NRMC-F 0135]
MLKDTILKFLKLDGLVSSLNDYVETRLELLKYEVKTDIARAIAKASIFLVLMLLVGLAIVFLSIAGALLLGTYVGTAAGFVVISGFYLLLIIIMALSRERLTNAIEEDIKKHFKKKRIMK